VTVPFRNSILAGTVLVREAVQSPNYATGNAGWIIRQDGTAEFADLVIRSSDGSGSTVIVANGSVEIEDGAGHTVVQLDSDGYRLYDSLGDLVAQITLDSGGNLGGFYCRNFVAPENVYAFLSGGQLISGPVNDSVAALHGFLQYVIAPSVAQPYAVQTLSTGAIALTDNEARIQLVSQRGQRSVCWVDGGSSAVKADLLVTGKVAADNIRSGSVTTPAPGAGGGTTTQTVTFADAMDSTPRVVLTPVSTVDPATVAITAYVDSVTTSGFTVRCYRSTNSTSAFSYIAISS